MKHQGVNSIERQTRFIIGGVGLRLELVSHGKDLITVKKNKNKNKRARRTKVGKIEDEGKKKKKRN